MVEDNLIAIAYNLDTTRGEWGANRNGILKVEVVGYGISMSFHLL